MGAMLRGVKRKARAAPWLAVSSAIAFAGAPARADEPAKPEREKLATLLRTAAEAAQKKSFAACADAYAGALQLEASPKTQGELGVCEEALRRNPEAYLHLSAAMDAPGADRTIDPWKRFSAALARVAPRIAQVFFASDPPHAFVIMDGHPLGKAEGRAMIIEPGKHTFAARLDGYADAVDTREVRAGDLPTISFQLHARPKPAPETRPAPPVKPLPLVPASPREPETAPAWYAPAWSPRGVLVTATYAGLATTLASGAAAIGLEVDRGSIQTGLAKDACAPEAGPGGAQTNNTSPRCVALHQRLTQHEGAVNTLIGTAITTGVLMAATGLAIHSERSHFRPSIALTASSQGGGIVVFGAW
jgi:hypothetical protein